MPITSYGRGRSNPPRRCTVCGETYAAGTYSSHVQASIKHEQVVDQRAIWRREHDPSAK